LSTSTGSLATIPASQSEIGAALRTVCGARPRDVEVLVIASGSFTDGRCGASTRASVRIDACGRYASGSGPPTRSAPDASASAWAAATWCSHCQGCTGIPTRPIGALHTTAGSSPTAADTDTSPGSASSRSGRTMGANSGV
jgi:hypothetical protein